MKAFIASVLLMSSVTTFAQQNGGNYPTNVWVDLNNTKELEYRVQLLEQAVRNLQAQINNQRYNEPRQRQVIHVCSFITANGVFSGEGKTEPQARAQAISQCIQNGRDYNCDKIRQTCEKTFE